jgi:xanthine/CO dehydrogenase XdhC/CoxF family maturation factor
MQWVLATIFETEGSSYRKPGAMMMINSFGQYFGLLSGGCLESDIMKQARLCWKDHENKIIQYDMREEEDLAWRLGIGCGGLVRILLQSVDATNDYLSLSELRKSLNDRQACEYHQMIESELPDNRVCEPAKDIGLRNRYQDGCFIQSLRPSPHVLVFGGGIDAIPLVNILANLGWLITVVDPRPSYARQTDFALANTIVKVSPETLENESVLEQIDAAVIMMHNVDLDAKALKICQGSQARYVGLLGPIHRTDRVLEHAGISRQGLLKPLANPIGLRLGGELPESIALSIAAEIHASFEHADARSISQLL